MKYRTSSRPIPARSPCNDPVSGGVHSLSAPIASAAATNPSADAHLRYTVVLCTPDRAATASTVNPAYPRSANSSSVAINTATLVRSVRPPGRCVPGSLNCHSRRIRGPQCATRGILWRCQNAPVLPGLPVVIRVRLAVMVEANLEQRVAALEEQVRVLTGKIAEVREDAAAARVLAKGADRDVAEFRTVQRSHTDLLNAMREDLTDFRGEVRAGFAAQTQGMERIVQLLTERGSEATE